MHKIQHVRLGYLRTKTKKKIPSCEGKIREVTEEESENTKILNSFHRWHLKHIRKLFTHHGRRCKTRGETKETQRTTTRSKSS